MFAGRVAVAACLMLALFATPALSDTIVEQHIPLAGIFTNDCTGEAFNVTGYFHTKIHMNVTLDGRITTSNEFNLESVKGVALVGGATYVMTAETSQMWNRDFDFVPQTANYESHTIMNRLGENGTFVLGDDLYNKVLAHLTVNGNGTTTVNRVEFTFDCR